MCIELINTGSELMLGRILNTHQQWLCGQLADAGFVVSRQVAVPDTGPAIQEAVREALGRADLVITTGGLGPTSDDLTRDYIAMLLGRRLVEDPSVIQHIGKYFEGRGRQMPVSTRVQALVPEGGLVLWNPNGTAPGLAIEVNPNPYRAGGGPTWLIMLPGPPRELRPMFRDSVIPLLRRVFPQREAFVCRTLRTTGLPESLLEEQVAPLLNGAIESGLELGYCARTGQVDVRVAARGPVAEKLVGEACRLVSSQLASYLYGEADDELEAALIRLLRIQNQTVSVAESCTGGLIAHRLTNIAGASEVFLGGVVAYSNEAKQAFLGVRPGTLSEWGAVSEPTAKEMAEGARSRFGTDYAVAVTGIAGPSGGTPEKPVGTVYIALSTRENTCVLKFLNDYDRETFKQLTSQQALELVRRTLVGAEKKRPAAQAAGEARTD